jgi:hypothetical protein
MHRSALKFQIICDQKKMFVNMKKFMESFKSNIIQTYAQVGVGVVNVP